MLINEIENILFNQGNILIRAYYKTSNGFKHYYDFQFVEEKTLKGSYQDLQCQEFLYYLIEQENYFI